MATTVYNEKTITLQDGKDVVLRPLPIGRLRRFMAAWRKFEDIKEDEDALNIYINCSGIALEQDFQGKFDSLKASPTERKAGEVLSKAYKEYLEEVIDMDTMFEIMDVCGGLKLNDPNFLAAAAEAQEEDGQDST